MKKIAMFVFNGDPMCFIHVLLNALDMNNKGYTPKIIMEGASVKLIPELDQPGNPLNGLWKKALEQDLVEGVCKACSNKLGVLSAAEDRGFNLLDNISGHPAISVYQENGYEIITF
jgi:hypothetical protein